MMLLLPINQVPEKFTDFVDREAEVDKKFINGFRNCLTKDLEWILIKDDICCGQAYCFGLKNDKELLSKLESYEKDSQKIEIVQNNYILVSVAERRYNHSEPIDEEKLKKIIEEVGGQEVAKNILLNSFYNYEDFKKAGWLKLNSFTQLSKEQKISLENRNHEYVGQKLLQVPQYKKQTGNWDEKKRVVLKIEKEAEPKEKEEVEIIQG